jgi:hypothetical protein
MTLFMIGSMAITLMVLTKIFEMLLKCFGCTQDDIEGSDDEDDGYDLDEPQTKMN